MRENWAQPNPTALLEETDPPLPDTESLLSELGAFYPVVAYPGAQEQSDEPDTALDQTIYAGLVWP